MFQQSPEHSPHKEFPLSAMFSNEHFQEQELIFQNPKNQDFMFLSCLGFLTCSSVIVLESSTKILQYSGKIFQDIAISDLHLYNVCLRSLNLSSYSSLLPVPNNSLDTNQA